MAILSFSAGAELQTGICAVAHYRAVEEIDRFAVLLRESDRDVAGTPIDFECQFMVRSKLILKVEGASINRVCFEFFSFGSNPICSIFNNSYIDHAVKSYGMLDIENFNRIYRKKI